MKEDDDITNGSGSGYDVTASKCLTLNFIMQYTIHLSLTALLFYSWQLSNLTHKFFSMYLYIYSSLHVMLETCREL